MPDSEHILVVDDHPDIRDALARYLKEHGYRVTTAGASGAGHQRH
jgi:two-component system OmpR family response regulator